MSSVIVRGMEMPESRAVCPLAHRRFDRSETRLACYASRRWCSDDGDERPKFCPLFETKDWKEIK